MTQIERKKTRERSSMLEKNDQVYRLESSI